MTPEEVILIDDTNTIIGTSPKSEVHGVNTPLHRGFSVFLFNNKEQVLIQQRSNCKKTWPLMWAGSCCGHPMLGETIEEAIMRRLSFELGITEAYNLQPMLPNFRYECMREGIKENEICPVWVGCTKQNPTANPQEVKSWEWKSWNCLVSQIQNNRGVYAEWCELEVKLLVELPLFHAFYKKTTIPHI